MGANRVAKRTADGAGGRIQRRRATGALGVTARLLLVAAAVFAGACAGSGRASLKAPAGAEVMAAAAPAFDAPAPPPVTAMSSDSAGATAQPFAPSREASPAPESRPGLGTEWGEERSSRVHDVDFERADSTRPVMTAELRYDDERGVAALAAYVADRRHRASKADIAGGAISMWLEDGDGDPLDVVEARGHTFVIGEAGQRYTIVIENHTGHRFVAVATVDGLDVINGKPGSLSNGGYLLSPYSKLEIDGFRQSERTVAAFRFGRVADSYAAKVGSARNVGVIGVAFFGEKGDRWNPWADVDEAHRRATANPFPGDGRFALPPR